MQSGDDRAAEDPAFPGVVTVARRTTPQPPASVVEALQAELVEIAKRDASLSRSALAAAALELARQIDAPKNSATSKSMCAKELRETMARLRELLPAETEGDRVDELGSRRAKRLAGRPAS